MVPVVEQTAFEAPFLQNEAKFNLCLLKNLVTQLWRYKPSCYRTRLTASFDK